jgi:hypothetical protein
MSAIALCDIVHIRKKKGVGRSTAQMRKQFALLSAQNKKLCAL